MHWGFRFLGLRGGFGIERCRKVTGINSITPWQDHVLFWDFDEASFEDVEESLHSAQLLWELPHIMVLQSSGGNHFHAICLYRVPLGVAAGVLLGTKHVDRGWVGRGVARGYWTLRVSPRDGQAPSFVSLLPSLVPEDVTITSLASVDEYWEAVR